MATRAGGPRNGRWGLERGLPLEKKEKNTSLAARGALAHHLQRRTACNAAPPAMPHRLQHRLQHRAACNVAPPAKFKIASRANRVWKSVHPRFLGVSINFRKIIFSSESSSRTR